MLATALLVLLVVYRDLITALLVVSPALLMAGLTGLFEIKLSIFKMVIPTLLGIGIDGSIHIYERYREYSNAKLNGDRTPYRSRRVAGRSHHHAGIRGNVDRL